MIQPEKLQSFDFRMEAECDAYRDPALDLAARLTGGNAGAQYLLAHKALFLAVLGMLFNTVPLITPVGRSDELGRVLFE